jgi:hypothetical protein
MSADFHIGQQVVCINDEFPPSWPAARPFKGQVYTIRDIVIPPDEGKVFLRLEEIILPMCALRFVEGAFGSVRFRACKPTNIGVFTRMLECVPEDVTA